MLKIGYSGPFPPHPSGGAALSYWLLCEMAKREDIEVHGYSVTKSPFIINGIKASVDPLTLDAFLFYYNELVKRVAPHLKGKVLMVAHHGFDNVMGTAEEFVSNLADADVVIATDEWEKGIFEGVGLKNVVIVPYPTDTSVFTPTQKKNPIEILYAGRLLTYKGIIQVIQAMDYVMSEETDVHFRVHGYIDIQWDGYLEIAQAIKALLEKYGNRVVFNEGWTLPWDMPKVYDGAHVFLFPSGRASFGIPMAEAMSCEIPVITTSYGSHGEVVGDAGILLTPKVEVAVKHVYSEKTWVNVVPSPEDIADATLRLIRDEELRAKLGRAGRDRVKKYFDSPIVVNRLLEVIDENRAH